jgi:hypothetical protein
MHATPRDIVIFSLLVALGGTLAFAGAVVLGASGGAGQSTMQALAGLGLLAWLYSAIAALEVASGRVLWQVAAAAIIVSPCVWLIF